MIWLQLETIAIVIVLIALNVEEVRRVKQFVTPFTLMSIPFIVVFLFTNLLLVNYNYPYIPENTLLFLFAQMVIFWMLGHIIQKFFFKDAVNKELDFSSLENFYARFSLFFIFLALTSAAIIIQKALSLFGANGGLAYFAHPKYEVQMTTGLHAHFILVAKVSFFFLVVSYRASHYKKIIILAFFIVAVAVLIVQIKYHILHIIFMALIYFTLNKNIVKQVRTLVISAGSLLILFNIVFVSIALAGGVENISALLEIVMHYMTSYLTTGAMTLDTWIQYSNVRPDWAPMVTFQNMYNAIVGDPHRLNIVWALSLEFMYIAPGMNTNVGTAYGPMFLLGGWTMAWGYTVFIGILFNFVFYLNFMVKNIFFLFVNLLFFTFVLFTFFVMYFVSPTTYEMPVILIVIAGGLRFWAFLKDLVFAKFNSDEIAGMRA